MDSAVDFPRFMESNQHDIGPRRVSGEFVRTMNPDQSFSPRQGTGHIQADWAAKTEEDFVRKPYFRRESFHRLIVGTVCVLAVGVGLLAVMKVRRQHDAESDLAGQRRCVAAFASSDEFVSFVRVNDAKLQERLSAIAAQPESAAALLPEVAAWEKSHGLPSWAAQFAANRTRAGADRDELFRNERTLCELLARRGVVFDLDRRTDGRRWFVRSLQPFIAAFTVRSPEYNFPALRRDMSLQDLLLAAYGSDRGATVTDVERLFFLAAKLNATPPAPPPVEVADQVP